MLSTRRPASSAYPAIGRPSLRAALRAVSGDGDELDDEHARLHRLTTPTSLDRTIGDDDSNELVDLLPDSNPGPEVEVMARAEEEMVTGLLDILDPRAKYAVEAAFRPRRWPQALLP